MAAPAGGTLVQASGLLWKASVVNDGAAHQRWFSLDEGVLMCYKPNRTIDPETGADGGVREMQLDVDANDITLLGDDKLQFKSSVGGGEPRTFTFMVGTDERAKWVNALKGEGEAAGMVGKQSTTLDDSFVERYAMASAGSLTYYKSDAEETDPVLGEDGNPTPEWLATMRKCSFGMITSVQTSSSPLIFEFTAGGKEQQLAAPDADTEQKWILLLQQVCLLAHSDIMYDAEPVEAASTSGRRTIRFKSKPEQQFELKFSTATRVVVETSAEGHEVTRVITETITMRIPVEEDGEDFDYEDGEEAEGGKARSGSTAGVATPAGRAAGPKGGKMGDEEGEDFDFEDGEDPEGKKGRSGTSGGPSSAAGHAGPKGGKMGDEEGEDFDFEDGEDPEGKKGRSGTSGGGPSATGSADGPEEGAGKPKGRVRMPSAFGVTMSSSEEESEDEDGNRKPRARKSSIHVKVKDASVPNWKRGFKTGAVRKWKDAAKVDNYIWTKSGGGASKFDVSFGSESKFKHSVKSKPKKGSKADAANAVGKQGW